MMKFLSKEEREYLNSKIREVEDFPKPGILFRDITTLLNDVDALGFLLEHLAQRYEDLELDFIAGTESRGFIFAAMLCAKLDLPFVPIRKPGKLPCATFTQDYALEYGKDSLQIHQDAFRGMKDARVLLVDDLIATGGTALASYELIKKAKAQCVEACFLINLVELGGAEKLADYTSVYSVLEF